MYARVKMLRSEMAVNVIQVNSTTTKQTAPGQQLPVCCYQINLGKGELATANVSQCLAESDGSLLGFFQEPYTTRSGRIPSLGGLQVFSANVPRAAIVATPDMQLWPMPGYTSADVVAVTWITGQALCPEIILISVYADINKDAVPPELKHIMNHCNARCVPMLICADSNAHSVLWGSPMNNGRGDSYEEFVAQYNLAIINLGAEPTFETSRAKSHIDITLAHFNLCDLISDWRVSSTDFCSDHKCIEFEINLIQPSPTPVKNWQSTDWTMFESRVLSKGAKWESPMVWTESILDAETEQFTTEIYSALDKSTPSFIPRRKLRKNVWWTPELADQRKILRVSYRTWKASGSTEDRLKYVEARQYMGAAVRKAKATSWQNFCSGAHSAKELSRINKILQRKSNKILGLVCRPDGSQAITPKESINILLDEHFPGSIKNDDPEEATSRETCSSRWGKYPWLSEFMIRRAIDQFSPQKTPGCDNLKPVVLQHLPSLLLQRMSILFKASMELCYVPKQWRTSKAIFIPKMGKDDYSQPRAWRPISLMSFVFKTLERLILWHMEDTILQEEGIHMNQHAFRKGRSTESALSDTVDYLESEVLRKGHAVGVFLDIEGAFDNLLPEGVIRSLRKRQAPEKLVEWFSRYLSTRDVNIDYKGITEKRRLVKGTPQGGVLSPVLWNLAFDEVLTLLEGGPIKACGYADDLVLIGRGPDASTILNNMQQALNRVAKWGLEQGLRFSASKSVAIAFTRKLNWNYPKLKLNDTPMEWQTQVKYLGITLEHKLRWNIHLRDKITKAKRLLYKYKQIVGTEFGPQPKYMRWMYTGIVRPMLCYGAVVWWRITMDESAKQKLTQLNRLALLTLGAVRRGTPTAGMEVISHIPPVDLYLEGEVLKTWIRIKNIRKEIWDGVGSNGKSLGHRRALRNLAFGFKIPNHTWDEIPETKKWTRKYQVDTDFQKGHPTYSTIKCFTDGTQTNNQTGVGYCIMVNQKTVVRQAMPLGKYPTVFQAEVVAILKAAVALTDLAKLGEVTIFSDSRAALQALDKPTAHSATVLATMYALDALAEGSRNPVKLAWVKPHAGHAGNDIAMSLAKEGSNMELRETEPLAPVPKSQIKHDINEEIQKRWNQRWHEHQAARQCKLFWPSIELDRSVQLLLCDRIEYSELVRLLTGHNYLNRHRYVLKETDDVKCRLCFKSEESSEHLLCQCPEMKEARFKIMGRNVTTPKEVSQMPTDGLRRYISLLRQRLSLEGLEKI